VTYQVSDSFGQTDSATITPTVGPPPLPVAVNDALTSNWDTNQTYTPTSNDTVGSSFPLLATTVKLCNTNQSVPTCSATTLTVANEGTYTVNANGTVTFDPLPTFRGTATAVTYQATDSLGRSDDATITPTVTPPPAPAATPETKPVIPGGTATFTTITGTSGLATGTQLQTSGANATCLITPGSSPAACEGDNSVTITGEGTFTLNPTTGIVTFVADANATAGTKTALTYRVTDVTGQTATSTLTPVIPQPPVASPDTNTGDWDTNQTISILTNDTAGDVTAPLVATTVKLCGVAPSAQTPNNCTQTSLTIANQGTYTVNANGTVTFDPLPTFNGTATAVRYQVADTLGQVANTTITPTVRAPRAPIPTPDINTGNWDTNQTISPLANDTPGEPTAPLDATTVKLCGVAPNAQTPNNCTQTSLTITNQGTYTVNANGTVTFDPLPSFTGTATAVKYQVTDVIGQTVNTTITPTVLAPPAPVASPGTVSLIAGGTEEFDPIFGTGALAAKATGGPDLTNSTVCIVDPATTVCGTTSVTIAGEGTFTLDTTTGIVTYTALSTATSGTKTAISYKITDALNVTVTSTLTPSIIPKPTARPDTSIGVMEKMQTLSPVGNDSPGATTYPLSATTVLH
jgi:CshA-type fibril repeat protein